MNSLRRNNPIVRAAVFLVFGLFLIGVLSIVSASFKSGVKDFFSPVLLVGGNIRNFFENLGSRKILELEAKNTQLEAKNVLLESQIKEIQSGTSTAGYASSKNSTSLVLSQAPRLPYDTLLISRDASQKIVFGTKVTAFGGIYLGDIIDVGEKTATAKLISYPNLETEAWLDSARLNVALIGQGNYNLKFLVPKDIQVKPGDKILSNTNPQFFIAKVTSINEKPIEPLKEVFLHFPFNFKNLRYVELVD